MPGSRVDANQKAITAELRALGYSVLLLHTLGKGAPDMLVSCREISCLAEIKRDKRAFLTDDEQAFHAKWSGHLIVATTAAQVHEFMCRLRSFVKLPE